MADCFRRVVWKVEWSESIYLTYLGSVFFSCLHDLAGQLLIGFPAMPASPGLLTVDHHSLWQLQCISSLCHLGEPNNYVLVLGDQVVCKQASWFAASLERRPSAWLCLKRIRVAPASLFQHTLHLGSQKAIEVHIAGKKGRWKRLGSACYTDLPQRNLPSRAAFRKPSGLACFTSLDWTKEANSQ